MIWKINSIIFICILFCASWVPCLRSSGSEIVWSLGFELVLPVGRVMGAPFYLHFGIQSTCWLAWCLKFLWHMVRIFCWSFTWHTGWLDYWHFRRIFCWFVTGTSTCIPTWIFESWSWYAWHNTGRASWFIVFRLSLCISYIISNMNSVRSCQLLDFLTLSLSPTWLVPSYGGRCWAAEHFSSLCIPFTLGMD